MGRAGLRKPGESFRSWDRGGRRRRNCVRWAEGRHSVGLSGVKMSAQPTKDLKRTPLYDLHCSLGARMVPFAGFAMPLQYPTGIKAEHLHTRIAVSLFDVSHMGQVTVIGVGAAPALEQLVPGDIDGLLPGRMYYTMLTNNTGGIVDDLMVTRIADERISLVVNASCREQDLAHLKAGLPGFAVEENPGRALLALQGPGAAGVLAGIVPEVADMRFMSAIECEADGVALAIARAGYTGEDGFEISMEEAAAAEFARRLLDFEAVEPAGLGARDSLRLEAGLCLYGADIDDGTTPVEAGLGWTIGKRRREDGGFPGAAIILDQLGAGPGRLLVGIRMEGGAPARAQSQVCDGDGTDIGEVTSGCFGPSFDGPVALGYVAASCAEPGTRLQVNIRGTLRSAETVKLPFIPHRYFKG